METVKRIIRSDRSLVLAADVRTFNELKSLAQSMADIAGIGAFKLGFALGLQGLAEAVKIVKGEMGTDFPVIYDHQKAPTDIPATGKIFADVVRSAGVDATILFPLAGPATQEAWTRECQFADLEILVGGIMTHPEFLVSEGGYIADEAVMEIYDLACDQGVSNFVVPGTKLDWVKRIRELLVQKLGEGKFALYAPGFITQAGDISECGKEAGNFWHAIVGSTIYDEATVEGRRRVATALTAQINP